MAKNNLKKILTEEGLAQTQLATTAKLSPGTINKVANQTRQCSPKTNFRIIKGLNSLTGKNYKYEEVFPNTKKY